jgi:hypothetical protein
MKNIIRITAGLALYMLVPTAPLLSQQKDNAPSRERVVEELVAQYVRKSLPQGKVVLDQWTRTGTSSARFRRDASDEATLAQTLGAEIGDGNTVYLCTPERDSCWLSDGVAALVSMSRPAFVGDTAFVLVSVNERATATAGARAQRYPHLSERTIRLVRAGTEWRVLGPWKNRAT